MLDVRWSLHPSGGRGVERNVEGDGMVLPYRISVGREERSESRSGFEEQVKRYPFLFSKRNLFSDLRIDLTRFKVIGLHTPLCT